MSQSFIIIDSNEKMTSFLQTKKSNSYPLQLLLSLYSSCFTSIFSPYDQTLFEESLLNGHILALNADIHSHTNNLPTILPHGWAFFISTTSYKLYCFCSILQTPLHIKSLFHSLTLHDYIKPYVDMEFQYHVNLGDF